MKAAIAGTLGTGALLAVQIMFRDDDAYGFLAWNMFLAWIAWFLAIGLLSLVKTSRNSYQLGLTFAAWLLFLPNTFYLLTDFVHPVYRYDSTTKHVADVFSANPDAANIMFDVTLIAAATWTTWLLGITSLRYMHGWLKTKLSAAYSAAVINVIILASSFGIFLGRIPRWNSWSTVDNSFGLVEDVYSIATQPFDNGQAYAFTAMFFVMTSMVYWSVNVLAPVKKVTR